MIILERAVQPNEAATIFPHFVEAPIDPDATWVIDTKFYRWCEEQFGPPAGSQVLRGHIEKRDQFEYNDDALWDVANCIYRFKDEKAAFEFKLRFC